MRGRQKILPSSITKIKTVRRNSRIGNGKNLYIAVNGKIHRLLVPLRTRAFSKLGNATPGTVVRQNNSNAYLSIKKEGVTWKSLQRYFLLFSYSPIALATLLILMYMD